ncbi:beta-propeller fold lactonase family protein [Microbacterium sp. X-17]|uniref:lactonase family protein n=1 Tax=Microbacterium sp. X-17 TaxID=3144404 RepID=UPI0031F5770F
MRFWVGGWTPELEGGSADGVGVLLSGMPDEETAGGPLAYAGLAAPRREGEADEWFRSPTWLAAHPSLDVVYASLESSGRVGAFLRTGEGVLEPFGETVEAGAAVCHLLVAPGGGSLVASCWGDGRVVRIALAADGRPLSPIVAAAAEDPHPGTVVVPGQPDRISRAHQAVLLPDGRIATTDLGYDLVRIWRPVAGELRLDHEVVLPAASGPRHAVVHPSGHLHVLTEYTGEVFTLAPGPDGRWSVIGGVPTGALPGDTAAELATSRDGAFLYAGLRGSNTLAVLRVRGDGASLEPAALVDAGVAWPWHHVVVRDTLLVSGQRSNEVVSLTLDPRTGVPGRVRHRAQVPSPTCVLPAR